MAVKTFAAIDVGSFEISMKIYEVSSRKGMRQVDHVSHSIDMGTDSYTTGKIAQERLEELFNTLKEFRKGSPLVGVLFQGIGKSVLRKEGEIGTVEL